jgi:predicted  nucleic acid-binding Zn-ribbon protein
MANEIEAARAYVVSARKGVAGVWADMAPETRARLAAWEEEKLKELSTLDLALDALDREQQEDAEDEADALAALADPSPSIPYEQVRRESGLDGAEIKAAREAIRGLRTHMLGDCDKESATLDRALDALAREPGFKQMFQAAMDDQVANEDRIAALEKSVEDSTAWIGKVLAERDALESQAREDAERSDVLESAQHEEVAGLRTRIAALESEQRDYERTCVRLNARLARVREYRNTLNGGGCAWEDSIKPFRDALDAALADAGPEVKP